MTTLSEWLLVGGIVVASVLVLVRSELVRRRRAVPPERRRALVVFQSGSALFVVTMVVFEDVFGLLSGFETAPAVRALALLVATCCVLYGYVGMLRTERTTA